MQTPAHPVSVEGLLAVAALAALVVGGLFGLAALCAGSSAGAPNRHDEPEDRLR